MKHLKILAVLLLALAMLAGCGSTAPAETAAPTPEPTAPPPAESEAPAAEGPVIEISVPDDFEGELNGRALFVLDYEMPGGGRPGLRQH